MFETRTSTGSPSVLSLVLRRGNGRQDRLLAEEGKRMSAGAAAKSEGAA